MKSLDELYKTDPKMALDGVPITMGYNAKDEPIIMVVAEAGNPLHQKTQRKYDRALESSRNNVKRRKLVMAKIIAESILKDWSGVLDSKKKEVKFTKKAAIDALIQYDRLQIDIITAADDLVNFRPDDDLEGEEETEKNSLTS